MKKIKTICSKSTENPPQGKIALIDVCASTTSLTQFSTSECCFFFLHLHLHLHFQSPEKFLSHPHWHDLVPFGIVIHIGEALSNVNLLRSARSWSRFWAWCQLLIFETEQCIYCNSVFKVGCFKTVQNFPLILNINCLFKYTQIVVWALLFLKIFLIKYGVTLPLLLLQAELSGSDTEHLMAAEAILPKGAMLIIWNSAESKLFYSWLRW